MLYINSLPPTIDGHPAIWPVLGMAQLDGRCTYVGLAQAQHGPMGIRPLPAWPDEGVMPRLLLWFTMPTRRQY